MAEAIDSKEQLATPQTYDISPMTGALGADITGLDVSKPLDPQTLAGLKKALTDYQVLAIRNQNLDPDDLKAFGEQFGNMEVERFIPALDGHPGVHILRGVSKNKLTTQNLIWHVDHSYKEKPSKAACLYAVDVPESGGDTLFASSYQAYETLSDRMKAHIDGLNATHDLMAYGIRSGLFNNMDRRIALQRMPPAVEHPLVITHPDSGRKMLFVNESWTTDIVGLESDESQAILKYLLTHATKPEFQCRVRWQNKTLLIWDNLAVQHRGIPDYDCPRIMHRVAIEGEWQPS